MTDLSYYIGVDHREQDAVRVATQSAKAYASKPLPIYYLDHLCVEMLDARCVRLFHVAVTLEVER